MESYDRIKCNIFIIMLIAMTLDSFLVQMGKRLATIREDSGLKQIPFAEMLEVSQSGYNSYERGLREIPVRVLRLLYTKLNVNPVWMMTGEGNPYNRDDLDLFQSVVRLVDQYISREGCSVEPERREKLIRFLIEYARQHGEFNAEIAEKYLRSAL